MACQSKDRSGLMVLSLLLASCGARAGGVEVFDNPDKLDTLADAGADAGAVVVDCRDDSDCPFSDQCFPRGCVSGRCQDLEPVVCDDGDECTNAFCDPDTAECVFTRRTFDEDGDGHFAPLPGFRPGAPGACGDDCDDTSPEALPGGREACDGVDNDCNGVVDDNFTFVAPDSDPVLLSGGSMQAGVGGVSHNGDFYGVSFSSLQSHNQNQLLGLDALGVTEIGPTAIARSNSDTFAGPILWTGRVFATAWEDRRDDNFEVYFNRLDTLGNKLGPDVRVSNAIDFSLDPALVFTGSEYVVVWADRRNGRGNFRVYGQRLGREGGLLTEENVNLTPDVPGSESPALALSGGLLGMAFNAENDGRRVAFRTLDLDLSEGPAQFLSRAGGVAASVTSNDSQFVVTWHEYIDGPGDAIWGSVIDVDSEVVVEARRVTDPAPFARSHAILPLGDRLLLIWAEYRGSSYDLYSRFLAPDLGALTEPMQLTFSDGNVVGPKATFAPNGDVGILYVDDASGAPQVFFTSLSCQ